MSYCDMIIEFGIKHIIGKRGEGDVTLAFSQRFNLSFSEECDTLLLAYNSLLHQVGPWQFDTCCS